MSNQRKMKRLRAADYFKKKQEYLRQFFAVFHRDNDKPVGHLLDISTGGMMMLSKTPVREGAILKLRVDLPEKINGTRRLTVDARSVWSKKEVEPECYYTGFEFLLISPEHVKIIEIMIDKYMAEDNCPEKVISQ